MRIEKLEKILNENEINGEIIPLFNSELTGIHVYWGDWKHDHLRLDKVMKNNGIDLVTTVITEDDGSDAYSATHYFMTGRLNYER